MDGPRAISPGDPGALALLSAALAKDPVQNLFLLSVLEEARLGTGGEKVSFQVLGIGDRPLAEADPAAVEAMVMVAESGLWVPVVRDLRVARALGTALRDLPLRRLIGPRAAADALWAGYREGRGLAPPHMARDQRLLEITADEMGPWVTPRVRLAEESDLPQVVDASAELQLAGAGREPRGGDERFQRDRCLERIRAGRTFVVFEGPQLLFKAEVGSRCRFGAQVEGVFTAPAHRGQGIATRALGQICRTLLGALPRLTLRADPDNRAALGLYRKLGFGERGELRLLVAAQAAGR